jgi:hypothetical protein
VQVGTRLVFKFSASHDLWLMASQSAYDSCDFSGAVELARDDHGGATDTTDMNNGLTNLYRAVATGTGDLLFACEKGDHCSGGQKVKITVQTDPVTVPDSPSPPPAPELIVGGASLWNSFSHTAQTVEVGTRLVFKYSSGHNLWQMPSQSAYDSCDFSGANELAKKNHGGGTSGQEANLYEMTATTAGTLWFACEVRPPDHSHCNSGQKVAITVTAASNAGDTASASPPPPAESAAEAASPPPPDESSAASRSGVTASTLAATALAAAVLAVAARA